MWLQLTALSVTPSALGKQNHHSMYMVLHRRVNTSGHVLSSIIILDVITTAMVMFLGPTEINILHHIS